MWCFQRANTNQVRYISGSKQLECAIFINPTEIWVSQFSPAHHGLTFVKLAGRREVAMKYFVLKNTQVKKTLPGLHQHGQGRFLGVQFQVSSLPFAKQRSLLRHLSRRIAKPFSFVSTDETVMLSVLTERTRGYGNQKLWSTGPLLLGPHLVPPKTRRKTWKVSGRRTSRDTDRWLGRYSWKSKTTTRKGGTCVPQEGCPYEDGPRQDRDDLFLSLDDSGQLSEYMGQTVHNGWYEEYTLQCILSKCERVRLTSYDKWEFISPGVSYSPWISTTFHSPWYCYVGSRAQR